MKADTYGTTIAGFSSQFDVVQAQLYTLFSAQAALATHDVGRRLDALAARLEARWSSDTPIEALLQRMAQTGSGTQVGGGACMVQIANG